MPEQPLNHRHLVSCSRNRPTLFKSRRAIAPPLPTFDMFIYISLHAILVIIYHLESTTSRAGTDKSLQPAISRSSPLAANRIWRYRKHVCTQPTEGSSLQGTFHLDYPDLRIYLGWC